MKLTPCVAMCIAGATLAAGSGVALATAPSSRGGRALETRKAPPPPRLGQERGSGQAGYGLGVRLVCQPPQPANARRCY